MQLLRNNTEKISRVPLYPVFPMISLQIMVQYNDQGIDIDTVKIKSEVLL